MCTTHLYTYEYPDGRRETVSRPSLCPSARHTQPCSHNVFFHHAAVSVPYAPPAALPALDGPSTYSAPYLGRFPPSPSYSPRLSASGLGSVDAPDRPLGSPGRDGRRPPGLYGGGPREQRVEPGRHRRDASERVILVDGTSASTAPWSPSSANTSPREPSSRRPVIVDEPARRDRDRPRVRIDIFDAQRQNKHTHREQKDQEEQDRLRRLHAKIAKANAEIDSRSPVPDAPASVRKQSSTSAAAAARSTSRAARDREEELLDAVRRLDMEEKAREERRRRHDEEAWRRRLMQRMAPGPRATVGPPGCRRHRVEYDDGVFRRG
ncbi:hypothetical protein E4U53_007827 [Claviceps sorghi]|nr:hypothetical protein E4U53_007827 [Claviceps sorghi]